MKEKDSTTSVTRALVGAAIILLASAALALASPQYLSDDLARRLWGVMLGFVVVIYANAAPKALTPLARMRCNPTTEQALRRFSGWTIVLGGLGFAGAWLFAPLENARFLSIAILGSALLLVALRYGWNAASGRAAC